MENKIFFKQSWDEITIAEFFLLREIERDQNKSIIEKKLSILSLLSGLPDTTFRQLPYETISGYFDKELSFLQTEIKAELKDYYDVNGKRYKLIRQISDLTAGQFIDLMEYTKEKDSGIESLHLILTVFLIPVRDLKPKQVINNLLHRINPFKKIAYFLRWKKAEGIQENYLETPVSVTSEELYTNLSISDGLAISVFFCLLNSLFSIVTERYLIETMNEKLKSASKNLTEQESKTIYKPQQVPSMLNGIGS